MWKFYLLVFFTQFSFSNSAAQSFLQLEKWGSLRTERYYEGEPLIFQLEGDKDWYTEIIVEILIEEKLVLFENRVVEISKIAKIRNLEKGQFWRGLGNKIMVFGAGFLGFSFAATLADWEIKDDTWIVSGTAMATGGLIRLLSSSKAHKMGKRKWLRPLNTDFELQKESIY